jgi:hypothetical protein
MTKLPEPPNDDEFNEYDEEGSGADDFTPLGGCILIDYRPSSRTRLKGYLRGMQMFDLVHESGSLDSFVNVMTKRDIHACVFGPSIRTERILTYLKAARETGRDSGCAFVATKTQSRLDDIPGVHKLVSFPCSQMEFNVTMVRALMLAHGGCLPEAKRMHPVTGKPISLKASIEKLGYPDESSRTANGRAHRLSLWPRETFDLVSKKSSVLRDKLNELQPFHLKFRPDGTPTEFTSEKISLIIDSIFPEADLVPGMNKFKGVLEELLYKWAQIGSQLGRNTANTCLKREIINCFGLSIQ